MGAFDCQPADFWELTAGREPPQPATGGKKFLRNYPEDTKWISLHSLWPANSSAPTASNAFPVEGGAARLTGLVGSAYASGTGAGGEQGQAVYYPYGSRLSGWTTAAHGRHLGGASPGAKAHTYVHPFLGQGGKKFLAGEGKGGKKFLKAALSHDRFDLAASTPPDTGVRACAASACTRRGHDALLRTCPGNRATLGCPPLARHAASASCCLCAEAPFSRTTAAASTSATSAAPPPPQARALQEPAAPTHLPPPPPPPPPPAPPPLPASQCGTTHLMTPLQTGGQWAESLQAPPFAAQASQPPPPPPPAAATASTPVQTTTVGMLREGWLHSKEPDIHKLWHRRWGLVSDGLLFLYSDQVCVPCAGTLAGFCTVSCSR